ncbi:MAG: hypothetical protein LIR50_10250 [Bacillota bacterium]|nr:hypothetical protein [Bacillota bacterium]
MTEIEKTILENQEVILSALAQFAVSKVSKNQKYAKHVNALIDNYHKTRKLLGKTYIQR